MLFGYFPQVLVNGQPIMSDGNDAGDLDELQGRVSTLPSPRDASFQVAIPKQRNTPGTVVGVVHISHIQGSISIETCAIGALLPDRQLACEEGQQIE